MISPEDDSEVSMSVCSRDSSSNAVGLGPEPKALRLPQAPQKANQQGRGLYGMMMGACFWPKLRALGQSLLVPSDKLPEDGPAQFNFLCGKGSVPCRKLPGEEEGAEPGMRPTWQSTGLAGVRPWASSLKRSPNNSDNK